MRAGRDVSADARTDLGSPELYINRELSWLEFNRRVLEQAERADVPLLERLKFIGIAASNLDEFYMVRVGGLERQVRRGTPSQDPAGDKIRPADLLREVAKHARQLNLEIAIVFVERVLPELEANGVRFLKAEELDETQRGFVHEYYGREVHPCLTPIA